MIDKAITKRLKDFIEYLIQIEQFQDKTNYPIRELGKQLDWYLGTYNKKKKKIYNNTDKVHLFTDSKGCQYITQPGSGICGETYQEAAKALSRHNKENKIINKCKDCYSCYEPCGREEKNQAEYWDKANKDPDYKWTKERLDAETEYYLKDYEEVSEVSEEEQQELIERLKNGRKM